MKTSVVIPCYNSQEHIRLCLGALLNQTVAPDEIIVVDSSTDETPDIIRREFPTVRLHHLEKQTMPGRGRNIGMDLASGDIILFTDSDAVANADWVEQHILLHETMPDVILFGGSILNYNPQHLFSRLAHVSEFTGYSKKDPAEYRTVVPSVNMSVKRDILTACGVRMPETALPGGEDVYFCNALVKLGKKVRFDPAPTIQHVNRTTWKSFIGHMRSSGYAAGVVAAEHAVSYHLLARIGPFALLAAPIRLLLVWKRLLHADRRAFLESLLASPVLMAGFLAHMWSYYKGADDVSPRCRRIRSAILTLAIISAVSITIGLSIRRTMTSDPSCYLNYAKQLSLGNLFFESLPAQMVYEHGGTFTDSVFQGYVFANEEGKLYPYVNIGFPLLLALWMKIFGLVSATLFNAWMMPFFLLLYWWFLSRTMPADDTTNRKWLGLLTITILFCHFTNPIASWAMTYRELPSVVFALFALILASASSSTSVRNVLRAGVAGVLLGIATTIRETSAFLAVPAVLLMAMNAAKKGETLRRTLLHCVLISAVVGTGLGIGYAPQLAINKIQKGSVVGKQFEKSTKNLKPLADGEVLTNSGGGLSLHTLKKFMPRRLEMIRETAAYWMVFVLAGVLLSLNKRYLPIAVVTVIPTCSFILLYSAFDQIPGIDRYEMLIYLFLVPLAAFGLIRSVELVGRLLRLNVDPRLTGLVLGTLIAIACSFKTIQMIGGISPDAIRTADLQLFQKEMSSRVDSRSIVLCELPARDYVQYLTDAHTASLYNILETGITIRQLIQYCADHGIKLFFFNAYNRDTASTPYASNEIEGMLASEGRLEHVYTVPSRQNRMSPIFGRNDPSLLRVYPLTNTATTVSLKRSYAGPCRLVVDVGVLEGDEEPEIILAGQKLKGVFLGHRRFIGDKPIDLDGSSAELQIRTKQPHSGNVRVDLLPPASSVFALLGVDASDLPFLGRAWFTNKDPSANAISRHLPHLADLTIEPCAPIVSDRATVYMGIFPIYPSDQKNVNISWSANGTNWQNIIRCSNADGTMVGFAIRNCPVRENIYLKNRSDVDIYPYVLAVGREVGQLDLLPVAPENDKGAVWNVLSIDSAENARTFAVVCPEWSCSPVEESGVLPANSNIHYAVDTESRVALSGAPAHTFILLYPIPFDAGTPLNPARDGLITDAIYQSGFYRTEREGRWMKPEAQIPLPPQLSKHGGDIAIHYQDHRPPSAPPTEFAVFRQGEQLAHVSSSSCATTKVLKCRVPPLPPTFKNNNAFLVMKSDSWRPSDLIPGCDDDRVLGLYIEKIELDVQKQ